MKEVVDDPDAPSLPIGCINAHALRSLAVSIDWLEQWHVSQGGKSCDHPCLRRIESTDNQIIAHVSSGLPVGGEWFRFTLTKNGWRVE